MSTSPIIPMPQAPRLHDALHAIKRAPGAEVALILPDEATEFEHISGIEQVLAWARAVGKDITLVGGSPYVRAEAVARGVRVATDVAAWNGWLADQRASAPAAATGWRIVPRSRPQDDEAPPAFVTMIGQESGILGADRDMIPSDERYEDAIIETLWRTGGLSIERRPASNG